MVAEVVREQSQQAAPLVRVDVGEQRATPDEVVALVERNGAKVGRRVHRRRTEHPGTKVDRRAVDVAGLNFRVRIARFQVAQDTAIARRQVQDLPRLCRTGERQKSLDRLERLRSPVEVLLGTARAMDDVVG